MIRFFLFAIPLAVILGYTIHSAFKYTRMIGGIFLSLVYKPGETQVSSSMGEKVLILDSGANEIEAIAVENKNSRKLVIFCPESGQSKESWEKYAYFLPGFGYRVMSVDFEPRVVRVIR